MCLFQIKGLTTLIGHHNRKWQFSIASDKFLKRRVWELPEQYIDMNISIRHVDLVGKNYIKL